MPKTKLPPISDADEARLQAGIASDPDNPEWTEEEIHRAKPFSDAFPEMADRLRRARGPQKTPTKELISIRLDHDVLDHFRASGPGWQSRVNEILRSAMRP